MALPDRWRDNLGVWQGYAAHHATSAERLEDVLAEAPAELMAWIPAHNALLQSEEINRTQHNLYTLRGAQVRNGLLWSKYIHDVIVRYGDEVEVSFGSHHWPTWGNDEILAFWRGQRDTYRYIHDEVLRLADAASPLDAVVSEVSGGLFVALVGGLLVLTGVVQRVAEGALGAGQLLDGVGIAGVLGGRLQAGHGLVAGRDHRLQGVPLVTHVALGGFHQIGNQIVPALELHVDLRIRIFVAILQRNEAVVLADGIDANQHDEYDNNDQSNHEHKRRLR